MHLVDFENRILKNIRRLKNWLKSEQIEAYRLYDKDIPEHPYLIDIYKNYCVVYDQGNYQQEVDFSEKHQEVQGVLTKVLNLSKEHIIFKQRKKHTKGGSNEHSPHEDLIDNIQEYGLQYEVNLTRYLDCGLFLDHRPLRRWILDSELQKKSVLNLFCYTGSLGLCAAKAGAFVTSVDLSKSYLRWCQRNFIQNKMTSKEHSFINDDGLTYLSTQDKKFDLIIIDPPTFSNSKKNENDFEVQKDHTQLISEAMKRLNQEGKLYFSTNKRDFKLAKPLLEQFKVTDITTASIPKDFRNPKIHYLFQIRHR